MPAGGERGAKTGPQARYPTSRSNTTRIGSDGGSALTLARGSLSAPDLKGLSGQDPKLSWGSTVLPVLENVFSLCAARRTAMMDCR